MAATTSPDDVTFSLYDSVAPLEGCSAVACPRHLHDPRTLVDALDSQARSELGSCACLDAQQVSNKLAHCGQEIVLVVGTKRSDSPVETMSFVRTSALCPVSGFDVRLPAKRETTLNLRSR